MKTYPVIRIDFATDIKIIQELYEGIRYSQLKLNYKRMDIEIEERNKTYRIIIRRINNRSK